MAKARSNIKNECADAYAALLLHISRHVHLTDEEKDAVRAAFKARKFRKRQYLVQAGDVCKFENFVVKGCLRSYLLDQDGNEHVVQFAIENWWIGDMMSFLSGTPANYNVEALEDAEVLQIDKSQLENLFNKAPLFERFFRILVQNAFIALQKRVAETISKTAEERYLDFSAKYPHIEQRVPQYQVASYLGITPEFLSKIRNKQSGKRK